MKKIALLAVLLGVFALGFYLPKPVSASEGIVEMRSTTSDAKCFAASVMMTNFTYSILLSCRNIKYSVGNNVFAYILWAKPLVVPQPNLQNYVAGTRPQTIINLGAVNLGKGQFSTGQAFSQLFITAEKNAGVSVPSSNILMSGDIQPIRLLSEDTGVPTPTPTPTIGIKSTISPLPTPKPTNTGMSLTLKIAAVAGVIVLATIITIVIVLVMSKA